MPEPRHELKERFADLADLGPKRGGEPVWREAHAAFDATPTPTRTVRSRRRWAVAVITVVTAAIGVFLFATRDQTAWPSVAVGVARSNLVLVGDGIEGSYSIVDLVTGATAPARLPGKVGGDFTYDVIATGGDFVYMSTRGVVAIPTKLEHQPRNLGGATVFLPSSRPGWVWLITIPRTPTLPVAQEVSVDGRQRGAIHRLPASQAPTAAVSGALIFGNVIWHPDTNRRQLLADSGPFAPNVFDAHASLVAWGLDCQPSPLTGCKALRVEDLAHRSERTYLAPPNTEGWITTAGEGTHDTFSPDGRQLAMRVALDPAGQTSDVYVLDLKMGSTALVPESEARAFSPVAWSPDGQHVLFETASHNLGSYDPASGTIQTFAAPCCGPLAAAHH